ncbi:hypothetical protein BDZ45DRAFT_59128 [Acephala macrosclerotiorum]|nr:hypothetical protein BDZ45DRAFT_59128 [Acephala macrosclerotiorum]
MCINSRSRLNYTFLFCCIVLYCFFICTCSLFSSFHVCVCGTGISDFSDEAPEEPIEDVATMNRC